jgi:hypothetical protein
MKKINDIGRFFSKVAVSDPSDCWEWTGYCVSGGYGTFWYQGKPQLSHRVAWELTRGPIPDGMCVCHSCDNPKCVNYLNHLWLGTNLENTQDRDKKNRNINLVGTQHGCAKLTEANVLLIRELYKTGNYSHADLGKMFNVDRTNVYSIVNRKTWRHV